MNRATPIVSVGVVLWRIVAPRESKNTDGDHGMASQDEVLAAEDGFFQALLQADPVSLTGVLTPDFLLIDVMTGSEIPGPVLVDLVGSRQLRFDSVNRIDARVRLYNATAVVTGQTRMQGRYGEQRFEAHSRYTHVYVQGPAGWQLASAQGTPISS
jgi:hypothetical protein